MDITRTLVSCPLLVHLKLLTILLLLIPSSFPHGIHEDDFDDELYGVIHAMRNTSSPFWTEQHHSRKARSAAFPNITDNSIWSELWHSCRKRSSFSCVKAGMFKYLDKNLEVEEDVRVSETISFRKNINKWGGVCENSEGERERCTKYYEERLHLLDQANGEGSGSSSSQDESANTSNKTEARDSSRSNEEDILENDSKDINGMSDVTDILYDKGAQFLMTHDLQLDLPNLFFGGGAIRIEPKGFVEATDEEEEGAMIKLVFKPPDSSAGNGRLLFHHLKKLFKKKLMHSFMALLLIIKMIKVKLMFLLPMIVGQSTAKKLLLKVLLFLIPGLAHLFKLCHYYHLEHSKYHHHHHKIQHHHHHIKVPVPVPVPISHLRPHPHIHHHVEPNVHHLHQDHRPYPPSEHSNHIPDSTYGFQMNSNEEFDYPPLGNSNNGGGGGGGYHRNEYPSSVSQYNDNEAAMTSWGLGSESNFHETGVLDAKDQPVYFSDDKHVNKKSPSNYNEAYYAHINALQQASKQVVSTGLQPLTPTPPLGATTIPVVYDPFYSPILQKIDNIFSQLGFNEEACRERLVCSMYKAPHRFSPHSNLLSNELSRDPHELQRPVAHNSAVVRFYKYVNAARLGQEQKDCLRLYPACTVNTEK